MGLSSASFGLHAGFLAFTLPSALLLYVFALFSSHLNNRWGEAVVHGLKLLAIVVVAQGVLKSEEAFQLSRIDEIYQAEKWGADGEAARRFLHDRRCLTWCRSQCPAHRRARPAAREGPPTLPPVRFPQAAPAPSVGTPALPM